jgi:hypothetical protein
MAKGFEQICSLARKARISKEGILALAESLPGDDKGFQELVDRIVAVKDDTCYQQVVLAGLSIGRALNAAHLVKALSIFQLPEVSVPTIAGHCQGDVASALLTAARGPGVGLLVKAVAFFVAAWWIRERQSAATLPEVAAEARRYKRDEVSLDQLIHLTNVLDYLGEDVAPPGGASDGKALEVLLKRAREYREEALKMITGSILDYLPETESRRSSGFTIRRAEPKIGRNDPCRCGSGKKYKKCCLGKDVERESRASNIPGVTWDEFYENLEAHVDKDRLEKSPAPQLAKLDPGKLDPALREVLLGRLISGGEYGAVIRFFEATGYDDSRKGCVLDAVSSAAEAKDAPAVRRLLDFLPESERLGDTLPLGARLLLLEAEPGPYLSLLEKEALRLLDRYPDRVDLVHALLKGACPALGILAARGILCDPDCGPDDCEVLLDAVLTTRDVLGVPPEEPTERTAARLIEERWTGVTVEDGKAERNAERLAALEQAYAEARKLRDELGQLRRALGLLEKALEAEKKKRAALEEAGDSAARLDAKVTQLKNDFSALSESYQHVQRERNAALCKLSRSEEQRPAEAAPIGPAQEPGESGPSEGEGWVEVVALPAEGAHPFRIPELKEGFLRSLRSLPDPAARTALRLVGRLAAGDPAAFSGQMHLEHNRKYRRVRAGSDYRLIFVVAGDIIQIVDIVNRRELNRFVKRLPPG